MNTKKISSNNPSFQMRLNIKANNAILGGRTILPVSKIKELQKHAALIGSENDVLDLMLGSVTKISTNNPGESRLGYTILGTSLVNGKQSKVNLNQSWLSSIEKLENHDPFVVILKHLDSIKDRLKMKGFQKKV